MRRLISFVILFAVVVFLLNYGNSSTNKMGNDNLQVVEAHTVEEGRYFSGTIKNNSKQDYYKLEVEISLFDRDGKKVGTTKDSVNSLKPGQVWNYKAAISSPTAVGGKVEQIIEKK